MLVIGETGSGKTTLLNALVNYLLGIKFEDNFRFKLIVEQTESQIHSITNTVSMYSIKSHCGNPPVLVIDTPGFGDTKGIEQDKIITKQIQKFFNTKCESLNAVCFVAKASNGRLTAN